MELQAMDTTNLLIAFLLFIGLLLTECSVRETPIFEVPEDTQAVDLRVFENWDKADFPR
jgi:hypothetical protein